MEKDFSSYSPYVGYNKNSNNNFTNDDFNFNVNTTYSEPILNPIMQYEQAYNYYRFLCMQMDYKIKCKEYEKLCGCDKSSCSNNSNATASSTNQRPR